MPTYCQLTGVFDGCASCFIYYLGHAKLAAFCTSRSSPQRLSTGAARTASILGFQINTLLILAKSCGSGVLKVFSTLPFSLIFYRHAAVAALPL